MDKNFLNQKRSQINDIDNRILQLLKERLSLMPEIAKYKTENSLPIFQPDREKDLLRKKSSFAKELGLSESFVTELFTVIMAESKRVQEKYNN